MKLNGIDHPDFSGTVDQFVQSLAIRREGIAVAVNETVVPKAQWDSFELQPNDKVLVIKATQGG